MTRTTEIASDTSDCQHCDKPIRRNTKGIWGARKRDDPAPWFCAASPAAGKRHVPSEENR